MVDSLKSDVVGAVASGLCVLHCLATPFLFVVQSTSVQSCSSIGPGWWNAIDYIFIVITFFAVLHSGKRSSKQWVKKGLWISWSLLTLLMLNEKMHLLPIAVWYKHIAAFSLIVLHFYNLRYCSCEVVSKNDIAFHSA